MTSQFDTTDRPRKVPSHEVAYTQLRDMILFGQLTPGQSVTIQGLTDLLGTGMTPVREAIRKLIAEGALDFQGNRRVCVPYLTAEQLDELAFARQTIEPRLVEMAAPNLAEQHIAESRCDRRCNKCGDPVGRCIAIPEAQPPVSLHTL